MLKHSKEETRICANGSRMFVNIYHILCENSVSSVPLCEYKILEGGCDSQSESPSDVHTHRECTAWRDYILTQYYFFLLTLIT